MKFLPALSPVALLSLGLALSSCANPANRRELYNTSQADSGPWHDYERRREAEAATGVSAGTAPTVVPGSRGRPSVPPPSSPLPAGTTVAPVSAPAQVTDSSSAGAAPVPVNPPSPVVGATAADAAPAPVPAPDVVASPTPASP